MSEVYFWTVASVHPYKNQSPISNLHYEAAAIQKILADSKSRNSGLKSRYAGGTMFQVEVQAYWIERKYMEIVQGTCDNVAVMCSSHRNKAIVMSAEYCG